jgi:hypothetical protein
MTRLNKLNKLTTSPSPSSSPKGLASTRSLRLDNTVVRPGLAVASTSCGAVVRQERHGVGSLPAAGIAGGWSHSSLGERLPSAVCSSGSAGSPLA